jgi:acyl-CoA synthetase (AMP-forming)/AMP-acid ligase II
VRISTVRSVPEPAPSGCPRSADGGPTDTLEQRVCTGGHPMPGMECRVVDPVTGVDLPPDTEGELLFRGSNCFSGYLNDPELTAQVFDDEGWFHTGDVATMDPGGRVTFISRLKDMLKVGGENVSAAEVESYLLRHPAVTIVHVVSARRLLRRGPGRLRPAQAGRDGDRRGDHRFLLGPDRDLPRATLRPVRH